MTAFPASTSERKTSSSSTKVTPSTAATTRQRLPARVLLRSSTAAVGPVRDSAGVSTVVRRRSTSCAVRSSWGPVVGVTPTTSTVPSPETRGGLTAAMPTSAASLSRRSLRPTGEVETTRIGPLRPGPNADDTWS